MIHMDFVSSFAFLWIYQIPIVNYMKWKNPDLKIHMTGLIGEDYYYKNEHGIPTIDAYTDVEPNASVRRPCAEHMPFFRSQPRKYCRTGLYAEDIDENDDFIIFCSRYHEFHKDLDPNGNRHANSDTDCDLEYLKLLAKEVKVYITGLPGECNEFEDIDNVESIIHVPMKDKPRLLLSLTNKARALVSTAASSIAVYSMCVGTPTMCFNLHRHPEKYGAPDGSNRHASLNPFGTYNHCYESIQPDAKYRFEETMKFLEASSNTPRFLRDTLIEEDNLAWRW